MDAYSSQRYWDDLNEGEVLPTVADALTFTRVAMATAASVDFFPVHHDPTYARSVGLPDVVLSTLQIMGFVDRVVTSWCGPATFISKRKVVLRTSIFPGDSVAGVARIAGTRIEDTPAGSQHLAEFEVSVSKNDGAAVCCEATVTARLPSRPGAVEGVRI